jgi:O-methyltransferase
MKKYLTFRKIITLIRDFFRKVRIFYNGNYFVTSKDSYVGDGLAANHIFDFLKDKKFLDAYEEGKKTGALGVHGGDIHYRAYIAIYFANLCKSLDGDFLECGTGKGLLAKTIVTYLNFNLVDKDFYLIDTYEGIPTSQAGTKEEKNSMEWLNFHSFKGNYFQEVQKTFANYKRVKLIKGKVPEILEDVKTEKISFISIDMNNAFAEIKCIEYFWDKITKFGVVLLDDYAYSEQFKEQKKNWDEFAKEKKIEILTLPTGQGLLVKY